ncbi:UPF0173 metal-dependent hydrolase [Aureimonas endophytica]|uniref:UPF0173 metal-dependent hydrolase GCM10011390_03930 n=1 Tax=Aureimonas endophytica TaxID=2027858 RepID=A0A916ZCD8_9HYPH|nr:metal-dependent hydrolase [Aureimonas endophytica]GGD88375.1 UPF0173 metal-dependent hydrolase [Aureimonas endophytica]
MKIIYFGHSAFRIETGSSVILIDPFLSGNTHFKGDVRQATEGATHILLSHGHADHLGDTVEIATRTGARVAATFELANFVGKQGTEAIEPMNTGGTVKLGDFSVTLTQAYHSSSWIDDEGTISYLGMPNGLMLHFQDGPTVYHMGDTDIFSDMALIEELHHPAIGMVPIGDRFTMGGAVAALACRRYFNFEKIVPIHWGTFPPLDQNVEKFREAMEGEADKILVPTVGEAFEI